MCFPDEGRAMRLTDREISKIKIGGKSEVICFDDKLAGFGIRVREGGSRTWIFQYRVGTRQRRLTIGSASSMSAAKAREAAEDLDAKVHLGGDPAGDKANTRLRVAESFGVVMLGFLKHQQQRLKPRSFREVERHMRINGKALHDLGVAKIDRRTIATQLTRLAETKGAVTANRARATWSAFFNWAAREGSVDANPAAFTNKRAEASRERVLTNKELRAIWNALPEGDYGDIVRLLVLTGQRREEIGGLRWSEIDFERGIITLPASRTKNGREHVVPMSPAVRSILEARPQMHGRNQVFGIGEGGFSGFSRCKERLDQQSRVTEWTLHDLRRTTATKMATEPLSIQPHIIEAVLNHVSGHRAGVAGIYNRSQYLNEKKQALALWADHLMAIVAGRESNIVTLARA
jgi:integrase